MKKSDETSVQQEIRDEAGRDVLTLWRNNVGACRDDKGRLIRYGLANDSARMNAAVKSSDLIGVMPVVVQPHHLGSTLGLFTAIEVKPEGWMYSSGDERAKAQLKFMQHVTGLGGIAGFARSVEEARRIWQCRM